MSRKPHLRTRAVMVVAALAWAQIVSAQTADPRRVEREIEIMAGILETTLRFAIEENSALMDLQSEREKLKVTQLVYIDRNRSKSVRGYYLKDQGVAFVVRAGLAANREIKTRFSTVTDKYEQQDVQRELQTRLEQRQADVKARIDRIQARTDTLKKHLVEALANHGDSMTILGEDEYLNLIIEPDSSSGWGWQEGVLLGGRDSAAVSKTLTVRKSWITDYKAGRLTMGQFKQKVLEY